MLQLSARFGVCVGKGVYGVAYVGYPGKQDVILAYDEGSNPAEAELLAVIRAVAKIRSTAAGTTSKRGAA